MILLTSTQAQLKITQNLKELRVSKGLTQAMLSERTGVSLSTLRKFEQTGFISFESFVKICMTLGSLEKIIEATQLEPTAFTNIDEVMREDRKTKKPKRGRRK